MPANNHLVGPMKKCAYCNKEASLTREHVIPAFIYAFQKEVARKAVGWNEVRKQMIGGEFKVKDVCVDCNNRVLGELDAHAKNLFKDAGLLVKNYKKETISFHYDYDLLLRWLLKVSFNSSRTDGAHASIFEPYVNYILAGEPVPTRTKVALVAYLAAPEHLGKTRIKEADFIELSEGYSKLNPFFARICYGAVAGGKGYTLRINIFGPLVFYILIFDKMVEPDHASASIRHFLKLTPNGIELSENRKAIRLKSGQLTWLDLYEPQVMRNKLINGNS